MNKQQEALRLALEALEIGHEYAVETAEHFHIEMAGYKQHRHDAMDAEVKQIADAITAILEALAEQQAHEEIERAMSQVWQDVPGAVNFGVDPKPAQQQEPKLPEFYARFEDGLVSVYQRREDATPLLLLRENLPDKQPAQQPVAWMDAEGDVYKEEPLDGWCPPHTPLYTSPPASKPWVGLTDEDTYEATGTAGTDLLALAKMWSDNKIHVYQFDNEARKIIEAVLRRASAKLREKNTGETK